MKPGVGKSRDGGGIKKIFCTTKRGTKERKDYVSPTKNLTNHRVRVRGLGFWGGTPTRKPLWGRLVIFNTRQGVLKLFSGAPLGQLQTLTAASMGHWANKKTQRNTFDRKCKIVVSNYYSCAWEARGKR